MCLSTLNVVHLTYSTNASLLKNFKATGYLGFFKVNSTYPGLQCMLYNGKSMALRNVALSFRLCAVYDTVFQRLKTA